MEMEGKGRNESKMEKIREEIIVEMKMRRKKTWEERKARHGREKEEKRKKVMGEE